MTITQLPIIRFLVRYAKTYKIKSALIVGFLLILLGMGVQTLLQQAGGQEAGLRIPKVSLLDVAEYRVENAAITSLGEVESLSQVQLNAQVSERVQEIRVSVGQQVSRGQVLVVLDNASINAQIAQAEATLDSAKVALQRAGVEQDQLLRGDTLNQQYEDGLAVLANVYDEFDTVVENIEDIYFGDELSSGGEDNIQYYANTTHNATVVARATRLLNETKTLHQEGVLAYQEAERGSGQARLQAIQKGYDLAVKAADTIKAGRDTVRQLQDDILNETTVHTKQATIDAHAASLASHASTVNGYVNSLLAIRNAINTQLDAQETSPISVQSAELQVKQAEAALQNLLAQQEKVVIASPISGTVAAVPVRVGEVASVGETVASVVNPGTLQIKTYINSKDAAFVQQGDRAVIEGEFEGSVTYIAPSLDPNTKKVEALVAVEGQGNSELVIGQFANVRIFVGDNVQSESTYFVPLQSIKVESEASFVYTLSAEHVVQSHQVELGRVIGDSVEVTSGIEENMQLVFSVRGLNAGDNVEVE